MERIIGPSLQKTLYKSSKSYIICLQKLITIVFKVLGINLYALAAKHANTNKLLVLLPFLSKILLMNFLAFQFSDLISEE